MRHQLTVLLITVLTAGSIGIVPQVMADEPGMRQMQGKGYGMGREGSWKSTLSDAQKKKIAQLKLDYKKKSIPLKLRIKQARVDLAMLTTADTPDKKNIDKKIDEILKLKGERMRLKADHKIAVRKLLNQEQRVQFDMKMLKKAYQDKKSKGHDRGHR